MGLNVTLQADLSNGQTGRRNLITDVPGIRVGHVTLAQPPYQTGVTAILPAMGNLYKAKFPAAAHVINGFGKSTGLVQVNELGTLESPLILTNTFAVGTTFNAVTQSILAENPEIGDTTSTFNPVILECNDGDVSDIRGMAVTTAMVQQAMQNAQVDFAEGAVGGGRGMMCYDLKGGIGSASRVLKFAGADRDYTIGALVMSNYGFLKDLQIYGQHLGPALSDLVQANPLKEEHGSIITILATDLPLTHRQLTRVAKRATVGINRTGGFIGTGSGEIVLAFSTANPVSHFSRQPVEQITRFNENLLDTVFRATAASVEEAVLSSMMHASVVVDRHGKARWTLPLALQRLNTPTSLSVLHQLTGQPSK